MKTDPTYWILTRASGLTAYGLLTLSICAGLVVKSRPIRALKAAKVTNLHRFLTTLSLGAVAIHGTALYFDTKIPFRISELLMPGIAPYRPVWTGVGIVSAELMLVIYLSFSARRWIGAKNWRRLHWLTYGVFGAVTVHGLLTGTDSERSGALLLYVTSIGVVLALTSWRVLVPPGPARPLRARAVEAVETDRPTPVPS